MAKISSALPNAYRALSWGVGLQYDNPMLLWKIDGSIASELPKALNRFGQRPETKDITPNLVVFHPGQAPLDGHINGLRVETNQYVSSNHFAIVCKPQVDQLDLFEEISL